MASYWLEERGEPLPRTAIAGVPEVEIVGGGVTGCSCALALAQAGVRVRLHEAREIAGGASGRNGGFALRGGAMAYDAARAGLLDVERRGKWNYYALRPQGLALARTALESLQAPARPSAPVRRARPSAAAV
jgi:glycine/D-amino acid oxidase-like deaminating enzyme